MNAACGSSRGHGQQLCLLAADDDNATTAYDVGLLLQTELREGLRGEEEEAGKVCTQRREGGRKGEKGRRRRRRRTRFDGGNGERKRKEGRVRTVRRRSRRGDEQHYNFTREERNPEMEYDCCLQVNQSVSPSRRYT